MGLDEDEKRAARLRLQIAVGGFDVAIGEGVSGGAIQAHGVRGSGHAAIGHAG